eukprot:CAMPEP_0116879408 /NCGR_PEP_ID=MMETSP0463-20121206/11209_1 /TAXON_ID=181622 /ORGANISM="Strombidinopsis sp, Strain SopsisLIS2011" /LENGTH=35 /DNA_ID= /DNA_START= /DNA_END= /DNA_ORIENTATION=
MYYDRLVAASRAEYMRKRAEREAQKAAENNDQPKN